MGETAPPPAGPLDAVFSCPGCGCLVVDTDVHGPVCPGRDGAGDCGRVPRLGPQVVEWLDSLDPEELERQALEAEGFDTNGTVAVLNRLKQLAASL